MIIKNIKLFLQNIWKNKLLTNMILKTNKDFNVIFIQELLWLFIHFIFSFSNEEEDRVVGIANYSDWITFSRTSLDNNDYSIMTILGLFCISKFGSLICIFLYKDICCFSFFNNSDIYYMINVYSDANQSALKYLKDTEVNVHNFLVIANNFNIRDNIWDLMFLFYLIHSNLLVNVADFFDFMLSCSTNQVLTRYLDNANDANSVINLMFFKPNSLEFNNYTLYPKLWYLSDYTLSTVNISIIEKFIPDKWHTSTKNSKEQDKFIFELIEAIKKINSLHLIDKNLLELAVQEFTDKSNLIWYKHSKYINIIKHSKAW